jgi:hypothetical protein
MSAVCSFRAERSSPFLLLQLDLIAARHTSHVSVVLLQYDRALASCCTTISDAECLWAKASLLLEFCSWAVEEAGKEQVLPQVGVIIAVPVEVLRLEAALAVAYNSGVAYLQLHAADGSTNADTIRSAKASEMTLGGSHSGAVGGAARGVEEMNPEAMRLDDSATTAAAAAANGAVWGVCGSIGVSASAPTETPKDSLTTGSADSSAAAIAARQRLKQSGANGGGNNAGCDTSSLALVHCLCGDICDLRAQCCHCYFHSSAEAFVAVNSEAASIAGTCTRIASTVPST